MSKNVDDSHHKHDHKITNTITKKAKFKRKITEEWLLAPVRQIREPSKNNLNLGPI